MLNVPLNVTWVWLTWIPPPADPVLSTILSVPLTIALALKKHRALSELPEAVAFYKSDSQIIAGIQSSSTAGTVISLEPGPLLCIISNYSREYYPQWKWYFMIIILQKQPIFFCNVAILLPHSHWPCCL